MKTVEKCNLCGNRNFELFEKYCWKGKSFNFVKCKNCGLLFLNPMPSIEESKSYYDEEYIKRHSSDWTNSLIKRKMAPIIRIIFRARISSRQINKFVLYLFFPLHLKLEKTLYEDGLSTVNRTGNVLDVGCGFGNWLSFMKVLGFNTFGCDIDSKSAEVTRKNKHNVMATDLLGANFPSDYFTIINFKDVLEHTTDPMKNLLECRRVISKSGWLTIKVPNHEGIIYQAFKYAEDVPYHNYSFSEKTLAKYLEKTGFRIEKCYTLSSPDSIYGQFKRLALGLLGRDTSEYKKINLFLQKSKQRDKEYSKTANLFDKLGLGTHLVIVARPINK